MFVTHPAHMLKIDPRLALVWRTPTSIQLGLPHAVLRREVTPPEENMLAALRAGATLETMHALGAMNGVSREVVSNFIAALQPTFERARSRRLRIGIDGHGRMAEWIAFVLRHDHDVVGVAPAGTSRERVDVVIVCAAFAVTPARAGAWLRREIPHLVVTLGDRCVEVSHVVRAGVTPCLVCLGFNRADEDPAWVAMLSQAQGKPAGGDDLLTCLEAALRVARIVDGFDAAPGAYSTSGSGESPSEPGELQTFDIPSRAWRSEPVSASNRCSCLAQPGSETALVA